MGQRDTPNREKHPVRAGFSGGRATPVTLVACSEKMSAKPCRPQDESNSYPRDSRNQGREWSSEKPGHMSLGKKALVLGIFGDTSGQLQDPQT